MIDDILAEAKEEMAAAVAHAQRDFSTIRTGRATPALIERLPVDYYGSEVPLIQLASFSVPEARMLVVSPFDKGSMAAIEKAIQNSDLGITPANDGHVIRLAFPALTEERRKDLVRLVKNMAEDSRISVRNHRRNARQTMEAFEKDGDISADDLERAEKQLDAMTHEHTEQIDHALEAKQAELMEV